MTVIVGLGLRITVS